MMVVTLEEMKQYLRVDYEDDDQLITSFIASAEQLCRDVLRADETADLEKVMRYTKENRYQVKGLARESSMDGILDVSCYETL